MIAHPEMAALGAADVRRHVGSKVEVCQIFHRREIGGDAIRIEQGTKESGKIGMGRNQGRTKERGQR